MKRWHWIVLCLVFLSIGASLILPIFDKRFNYFNQNQVKEKETELDSLGFPYGAMPAAVTDSWEFDADEGLAQSRDGFLRLGSSDYYVTSVTGDTGTDYDGFLRVMKIWNTNGTIYKTLIDTWEYDITDGRIAGIKHLSGDVYIVYYRDTTVGTIFTTTIWSSNGTLKRDMISTRTYTLPAYQHMIHVSGDVYALSYQEGAGGYDHFLETYKIWSSNGTIGTRIDVVEFDETAAAVAAEWTPHIEVVDSDTVAIVYSVTGSTGRLVTYNISSSGDITNTRADYWAFDAGLGNFPCIKKISGNVFAISFNDVDYDGWIKTITIADTGMFAESWIDTLEFNTANCYASQIFTINDASASSSGNGVYGTTYRSTNLDGWMTTMNISSDGTIGNAIIDSLEFDATDTTYFSVPVHMGTNFYAICYSGTGNDGWVCTVNILTNYASPTFSNPSPANNSIGQALTPTCAITINDLNGDTINLTWYSSPDGSTWTHRQYNASCANGTYRYIYTGATTYNTTYYWKVYANDGTHNVSTWYNFKIRPDRKPTFSNAQPTNSTTGEMLTPKCNITINDLDGDTMTLNWYENSTGSYVLRQTNASCANGTYKWTYAQATSYTTRYHWKVYANDGINNVSAWYYFVTETAPVTENITISNPYPANGSTGIATGIQCNITVNHSNGLGMVIQWYENSTGSWVLRQTNGTMGEEESAPTGTIYYVATTGSDVIGDGTIGNPYKTLRKAINASSNSDTIYMRGGNYNTIYSPTLGIVINRSGTKADPFTIMSYPGETAILNGNGYTFTSAYGILSVGTLTVHQNNITIQNLRFENSSKNAISAYSTTATGSCHDIKILNCYFYNITERAIWIYAEGTSTTTPHENITISNCTFNKIQNDASMAEAVTLEYCKNFIVSNNTFTDIRKIHLDMASGSSYGSVFNNNFNLTSHHSGEAIYVDSASYNGKTCSWINIYNNIIWGIAEATSANYAIAVSAEVAGGRVSNISIYNNIINRTGDGVSYPYGIGIKDNMIENVTVKYNTVHITGGAAGAVGTCFIQKGTDADNHNIIVANNIFTSTGSANYKVKITSLALADTESLVFYNNLYNRTDGVTLKQYWVGDAKIDVAEATAINASPQFVSSSTGNFHLNSTSPAIDAANSTYTVSTDYDGGIRPANVTYDIGAYEWNSVIPPSLAYNGTYRWVFAQASSYSLKYYWKVYINDGTHNVSNWYCFTTEAPPSQEKTWQSLYNSTLTFGNTTTGYKSLFTSLLSFGNTTTTYKSLFTSTLTFGNTTTGHDSLFTSTLSFGNISTTTSLFTSTLTFGNITVSESLFTSLLTFGNITTKYASLFTSTLTFGNISSENFTSLFTSNLSFGNISSNHSFFTSLLSFGNETTPHSLFTSLLTFGNTSVLSPATPYNLNLLVINPNPGNGTHNTNYLKSNASGLTTSIDIFYENFTTPAAYMPGTYSMTIIGTTPANTPVLWNASAVYATVHDTPNGIITPGNPYVGQYYLNPNYDIFRSFLMFDTSVIPDEATVTGAYVQLVLMDDYSDDDFNVTLMEPKTSIPHNPLLISDYFKNNCAGHFGHTNTTGYADEDIFNIILTPLGAAFIKKTSSTAYGVRSDQDINSSAPTGDEFVIFYGYGVATTKYPKLIINFTIPNSNWEHFVNMTWYSNSSGAWTEYYHSHINSNGTSTVPAINFSGIDTYFWHLEWESNHTNNGSSQVFTFTTVNASGGMVLINRDRTSMVWLLLGFIMAVMVYFGIKGKKKRNNGNGE